MEFTGSRDAFPKKESSNAHMLNFPIEFLNSWKGQKYIVSSSVSALWDQPPKSRNLKVSEQNLPCGAYTGKTKKDLRSQGGEEGGTDWRSQGGHVRSLSARSRAQRAATASGIVQDSRGGGGEFSAGGTQRLVVLKWSGARQKDCHPGRQSC